MQNIQFTENLKALADEWGCTTCQLALAWLHAQVCKRSTSLTVIVAGSQGHVAVRAVALCSTNAPCSAVTIRWSTRANTVLNACCGCSA